MTKKHQAPNGKGQKITAEHRTALMRLADHAVPAKEAAALDQAHKELLPELKKEVTKAWPMKEMKILAKYGLAETGGTITLSSISGSHCGCKEIGIPVDGAPLAQRLRPVNHYNYKTRDTSHIKPASDSLLWQLALEYQAKDRALADKTKELKEALRRAISQIAVAGKPMERLLELKKLWPDKTAHDLIEEIMAKPAVPQVEPDARELLAEVFK